MDANTEKKKQFLIRFLYAMVILGIAIFVCRYMLLAMLPFVIALLVSLIVKPVVRFLRDKCHVQKNVAGVVIVALFYAVIGVLVALLGIKIFAGAKDFVLSLPRIYAESIEPFLINTFAALEDFAARLNPAAASAYDNVLLQVTAEMETLITNVSKQVLGGAASTALSLPATLISVIIAIIATVFLAIDWDVIKSFVLRQLSPKNQQFLHDIRIHLSLTLLRYVKSYLLIMLITFIELFIGLSIVGIQSPVGIAALIAILDILPVVGSGTILIPWFIVALVAGNIPRGLGLLAVYLAITVIRNIIEPKIVGEKVGLHPIVTLMGMVVGAYVFGPLGILGLPVTLALIQSLNDKGVIHLYKQNRPVDRPGEAASGAAADDTAADDPAADGVEAEAEAPEMKEAPAGPEA